MMLKNTMLLTSALMISVTLGSGINAVPPGNEKDYAGPPRIKHEHNAAKATGRQSPPSDYGDTARQLSFSDDDSNNEPSSRKRPRSTS